MACPNILILHPVFMMPPLAPYSGMVVYADYLNEMKRAYTSHRDILSGGVFSSRHSVLATSPAFSVAIPSANPPTSVSALIPMNRVNYPEDFGQFQLSPSLDRIAGQVASNM